MNEKEIVTAANLGYLKLMQRMQDDILQTQDDIEWAEECEAEKEATLRAGSGVFS